MPHLSPMAWMLAPLLFFLILISLISSNWWSYMPLFPQSSNTKTNTSNLFSPWNWHQ